MKSSLTTARDEAAFHQLLSIKNPLARRGSEEGKKMKKKKSKFM